jgi:hypothetical protein
MRPSEKGASVSAFGLPERYEELAIANRIPFDQNILDGLGHVSFRDPGDANLFSVYQERFIHSQIYAARFARRPAGRICS